MHMIPTRTMQGTCEISTAALTLTSQPPAFQGEAGALQVQVDFTLGGSAFSPDASTEAQVYLYYPVSDVMTPAQTMTISGSMATATLSAEDQATPGAPYLVVQLTDTSSGALIVSCMAPLIIRQTRADTLTNGTAPNPSEVVYVGRAPYLSGTNTWMIWDNTSSSFVDSGISAIGPKGDPGAVQTVNGNAPDEQGNAQVDGLIYPTTAQALEAMSQEQQAALYGQGYRAIVATYNDTVTMHALEADGSLAWIGEKPRNLADNPNFSNPINQRGIVSGQTITNWDYFIDRWGIRADSGTINFLDNAIEASATIGQPLDPEIFKTGETVTAAAEWADGTICVGTGTISRSNVYSQFSSETINGHNVFVSDEGNGVNVVFNISAGTIKWAALYRGSYTAKTLPPWVAPDPVIELTKCQTYFRQFDALPQKTGYKFGIGMSNAAANAVYIPILLSPPMRAGGPPTISVDDDGLNLYNGNFFGVSTLYVYDYDSNDAGVGLIDVGCVPANNDITGKSTYMIILKSGKSLRISRDL